MSDPFLMKHKAISKNAFFFLFAIIVVGFFAAGNQARATNPNSSGPLRVNDVTVTRGSSATIQLIAPSGIAPNGQSYLAMFDSANNCNSGAIYSQQNGCYAWMSPWPSVPTGMSMSNFDWNNYPNSFTLNVPANLAKGTYNMGVGYSAGQFTNGLPPTINESGNGVFLVTITVVDPPAPPAGAFQFTTDQCTASDGATKQGTVNFSYKGVSITVPVTITCPTPPPPPPPTVTLAASPSSITPGASTTLTWTSTNAATCTGTGGTLAWSGPLGLGLAKTPVGGGSQTVFPLGNTTFSMTCKGNDGSSISTSTTVTVTNVTPPLSATLTASPSSGTAPLTSTLAATASGGTGGTYNYTFWSNCSYTGTSVSVASSTCGAPTQKDNSVRGTSDTASTIYPNPGTYRAFVIIENGSSAASASATVTVISPPPTVTLAASPSSITPGASTTLTWTSTNAATCTGTGGTLAWSGPLGLGLAKTPVGGGSQTVFPLGNTTFSMTCKGNDGSSISTSTTVTVTNVTPPLSATLTASPSSGTAPLTSTLAATASGGTGGTYNYTFWSNCSYTGTSVSVASSTCGAPTQKDNSVRGTSDTASTIYPNPGTYRAFVIIENGSSAASASATVTVISPPPTVTLAASPSSITPGASTKLTWSSTNATACVSSDSSNNANLPNTYGNAWDGLGIDAFNKPTSGSLSIAPSKTTTFTLKCTGAGGSDTQSVTVTVYAALSVSLSVSPSSGPSPLTTSLTATASGGPATGTYNFTFWKNCQYSGNVVSVALAVCVSPLQKDDGISTAKDIVNAVTYSPAGKYFPLVIVEHGPGAAGTGANVTATAVATGCTRGATTACSASNSCGTNTGTETCVAGAYGNVWSSCNAVAPTCSGGQTLSASLSAFPSSGSAPLTSALTASASNGNGGTYNFTFWKDCSYSGTSVSEASKSSNCGAPTQKDDNISAIKDTADVTYADAGTFSPLVIIENGSGIPAAAGTSVTVSAAGSTGCISGATQACISSANSCGMTNGTQTCSGGAYGTYGSCVPPSDSLCPATGGYNCTANYSCVQVSSNAEYPDQSSCQTACVPPPSATITSFKSSPATAIVPPETATLSWTSSNATYCSIDHGVGSSLPVNGSARVSPTATTVYTLTCTGPGGSDSQSATVTIGGVGQQEIPPS